MRFLTKLRQWINRDDGRFYQAGNRPLGAIEVIGLLIFIGAIILWQLHVKAGMNAIWAIASGSIGLLLAIVGGAGKNRGPHT